MVYSFSQKGGEEDGEVCPDTNLSWADDPVGAPPGGGSRRDRDGARAATLLFCISELMQGRNCPFEYFFKFSWQTMLIIPRI